MRRAGICFWMMIKRMGRRPIYWGLLLLFPAALFAVPAFNKGVEKERIAVGYVMESSEQTERGGRSGSGQAGNEWNAEAEPLPDSRQILRLLEERLSGTSSEEAEGQGVFEYRKYMNKDILKQDIRRGEISCGIIFDKDFAERLSEQDYRHCISLYLPEGMNVGGIVQEDVFRQVYQVYSAVWYAGLLGQQGYEVKPEEVLQKFSEYQSEGKVFAVKYEESEKGEDPAADREGAAMREQELMSDGGQGSVLSLRGILAFLTLMSASLGALDAARDLRCGAGKGISHPCGLFFAVTGTPILLATVFLAAANIWTRHGISDGFIKSVLLSESGSALLYGLILWLLAAAFAKSLPERVLEGVMPCFLLAVLLCCPIFFDLGESIPLMGHISQLFPITWYLRYWS